MATAKFEGQGAVKVIDARATHVMLLARATVIRDEVTYRTKASLVEANTILDRSLAVRIIITPAPNFEPLTGRSIASGLKSLRALTHVAHTLAVYHHCATVFVLPTRAFD